MNPTSISVNEASFSSKEQQLNASLVHLITVTLLFFINIALSFARIFSINPASISDNIHHLKKILLICSCSVADPGGQSSHGPHLVLPWTLAPSCKEKKLV